MHLDFCGYTYRPTDGYGNYCCQLVRALQHANVAVRPLLAESARAPDWLKQQWGIEPGTLTISCVPPIFLQDAPSGGRHWLISMTEGSTLPEGWADIIRKHNIERVIVPCYHNAQAFSDALPGLPIHIIPGGVDPEEFPVIDRINPRKHLGNISDNSGEKTGLIRGNISETSRPYTFLALCDRGARKGWCEVWSAFYKAFGTPTDTPDVRLILKCRPEGNDLLDMIAKADNPDPRVTILQADMDMREVYSMADCFAIPSRSEGWGLPHREAACTGLPVITQWYSGMDDGHTNCWSYPLHEGHLEPIPSTFEHMAGVWMRADTDELAKAMYWCWMNPKEAAFDGQAASEWLAQNQTWQHSAKMLIELIEEFA